MTGKKSSVKLFFTSCLLIYGLFFLGFSCKQNSSVQIDFSKTEVSIEQVSDPRQSGTVRFAVAAGSSPIVANRYAELFEYIEKKLGSQVEFVQRRAYAEINELLRTGEINFAILSSNSYVRAREEFGIESVAVPVINGRALSSSYVIVKADSGISKFRELKGKSYAFTHPSSTSGRLVPVYKLALMGETPLTFFSRYIFTYSNEKSVKAVEDGLVDGASVDSLVYDYLMANSPPRVRYTKIIDRSAPYGINPVVKSPHTSYLLRNQISRILLNLHKEQEGQRILGELKFDRFVLPDEESYKVIKKMRDFVSNQSP